MADLAPGLACAGAIGGGAAEGRGDITGTSRVTGVLVRCSKSRTEVRSCMRKI